MNPINPRFAEVAGQVRESDPEGVDPRSWMNRSQQQMESTVREFPGMAVVAALATGVLVGWFVKRL